MKTNRFYLDLQLALVRAKNAGLINLSTWFESPGDIKKLEIGKDKLPSLFLEFCGKNNGMKIHWDAKNIDTAVRVGNMEFIDFKSVLGSWEGQVYEQADLEYCELLEFFNPFDMVAAEFSCGFIIQPDLGTWRGIFLHKWGTREVERLDIDFEGYVTMLFESKAYANWPFILLDIQAGKFDSVHITRFRNDMPQVFPDFNWDNFVEKYENLRLSKEK